jgi:hypothetical protein
MSQDIADTIQIEEVSRWAWGATWSMRWSWRAGARAGLAMRNGYRFGGRFRNLLAEQSTDQRCRRGLMRAMSRPVRPIIQAFQSVTFLARQPTVHRLPTHAPIARHLAHRPTVGDDSKNRFVPLLSHTHLPHGRGVSRRYLSSCSAAAEGLSRRSRRRFVA